MFNFDIDSLKDFVEHFTGGTSHSDDYRPEKIADPLNGCRQEDLSEKEEANVKYIGIKFKF